MPQAGAPTSTEHDRLEIIGRTLAALDRADARLADDRLSADRRLAFDTEEASAEIVEAMKSLRYEAQWLVPASAPGCLALLGVLLDAIEEMVAEAIQPAPSRRARQRYERMMAHLIAGLGAVSGVPPRDLLAELDETPRRRKLDALVAEVRRSQGDRSAGANVLPFKAA